MAENPEAVPGAVEEYSVELPYYEDPRYWEGQLTVGQQGQPPYQDWETNQLKVNYILSKGPLGKVLDVGCAMGYVVRRLRAAGVDADGVDISRYALEHAPAEVQNYLILAGATDLPIPDGHYDLVCSMGVMEHFAEDEVPLVVSEMVRVARRGVIAITLQGETSTEMDPYHLTVRDREWWQSRFPPEFEVRSDANEEWMAALPPVEYRLPFKRGWRVCELGGGSQPLFHPNLDIRWAPGVDLPCDFNYPLPVPSESFEGIFAKFAIEHIAWPNVRQFVGELHRILSPGGIAVVVTANLLEQCKRLVEAEEWNDDLVCMIFGNQREGAENAHKSGMSPAYADKLFTEAGFYQVQILPWPGAITDFVIHALKSRVIVT